jgi:lipopolysaccharide assembly protein A
MQFLKIMFWCLLAFVAAVFTLGNWTAVSVRLFGGLVAEINLPLLLLVTFLIGFLPTLIYQHWVRWRLRQRLAATERALEAERAVIASRAAAASPAPATPDEPIASAPLPPADLAPRP